jgi:hypothetical protein
MNRIRHLSSRGTLLFERSVADTAYWYVICQSASFFWGLWRALPNMSQDVAGLSMRQEFYNDNGPGNRGHSPKVLHQLQGVRVEPQRQRCVIFGALQAEMG